MRAAPGRATVPVERASVAGKATIVCGFWERGITTDAAAVGRQTVDMLLGDAEPLDAVGEARAYLAERAVGRTATLIHSRRVLTAEAQAVAMACLHGIAGRKARRVDAALPWWQAGEVVLARIEGQPIAGRRVDGRYAARHPPTLVRLLHLVGMHRLVLHVRYVRYVRHQRAVLADGGARRAHTAVAQHLHGTGLSVGAVVGRLAGVVAGGRHAVADDVCGQAEGVVVVSACVAGGAGGGGRAEVGGKAGWDGGGFGGWCEIAAFRRRVFEGL